MSMSRSPFPYDPDDCDDENQQKQRKKREDGGKHSGGQCMTCKGMSYYKS